MIIFYVYFIQEADGNDETTTVMQLVIAEDRKDVELPILTFSNENDKDVQSDDQPRVEKNETQFPVFDAVPS